MEENVNKARELNDDDLGIEQKYITIVPYDSDDSDFEWHRRYNSWDEDDSSAAHSEKSPKREIKKKKKQHTSREESTTNSYTDIIHSTETLDKNEGETRDDSKNILRNHRNLVAASNPGVMEASPIIYPNRLPKANLNNSFPKCRTAPSFGTSSTMVPPYVTPCRRTLSSPNNTLFSTYSRFKSNLELAPNYKNYQLLGDSQLLRFTDNILSLRPIVNHLADNTKKRYRGYCVSGQSIKELEESLLKREHKLSNNVIMLIGTNDFLQNNDYDSMCASYSSIVRYLKDHTENIVLLTVPPIPKFGKGPYWYKFRRFNEYITNLSESPMITVVDAATAYIGYDNVTLDQYFEQYYENNIDRIDLIHLNNKGLLLLKFLLDIHIFDS